jgi:hypothetical protein
MLRKEKIKKLIEDVFAPKEGEKVVMLYDMPKDKSLHDENFLARKDMNHTWYEAFYELGEEKGFSVEKLISYEPTGSHGGHLPEKAIQDGQTIDLTKITKSWDERHIVTAISHYSATGPIFGLVPNQGFRAASMPGATMDMTAFLADYKRVAKKATILAKELTKSKKGVVEFSNGDKCTFDLRAKRHGHADDGCCQSPGQNINLPSGEAYVAPYEGKDKKLGKSKTKGTLPTYFGKELVRFKVNNGKIEKVLGKGRKTKELNKFFKADPARRYIAEFGLGCNDKAVLCGSILQDEKIEGFHWAYGYNAYLGGAIDIDDFKSKDNLVHQDIIYASESPIQIKKITLTQKGKKKIIMQDNKYVNSLGKVFI